MRARWSRSLAVVAVTAVLPGCSEPNAPDESTPATLSLSSSTVLLQSIGESSVLTASVKDAKGSVLKTPVTWQTGDPAIASVTDGRVEAVSNGSTTITATAGDLSASASLTVRQVAAAISTSPSSISFEALGASQTVTASVADARGHPMSGSALVWLSADSTIAHVGSGSTAESAVVTARANGTSSVRAALGGVFGSTAVAVSQTPVDVTVTPAEHTLVHIGQTLQLAAVVRDGRGNLIATPALEWTSSNTSVVSVTAAGVVRAVGPGTATVRATSGSQVAAATLSVVQKAAGLTVSPAADTLLAPGATTVLAATVVDAAGSPLSSQFTPVWQSSNLSVVTVSSSGVVTAIGRGIATVRASVDTLVAVGTITVDDFGDLGIGWIHRAPAMNFVWGSSNPTRDGWPAPGQMVTWQAFVKNWSVFRRENVPYRWQVDGVTVATGKVTLEAGVHTHVALPRPWSFSRDRLSLELDHLDEVEENEERNNMLEVFTDALSIGFWVERSVYDYFALNQRRLGVGSNSWEDWAQRHVRIWNQMFADARFPLTPNGVLDRLRIDKIVIVPDGSLPLAGGIAGNHPDLTDRSIDLQWGFPVSLLQWAYKDHTTIPDARGVPENMFYFEGSLLHELGHARYLGHPSMDVVDGVWKGPPADSVENRGTIVQLLENGEPVAGSRYMPFIGFDQLYPGWCGHPWPGLMSARPFCNPDGSLRLGGYSAVDEHSAAALNRIAGHRATLGNYNASGNGGVYLRDLPGDIRVILTDANGQPLANATIDLYRPAIVAGRDVWDAVPDMRVSTGATGEASFGPDPWQRNGQATAIIRVAHQGKVGYAFLDTTFYNMEYWRGNTAVGRHTLIVRLH